eukprot:jgi/Psemu1/55468/gm1.55468_g
MATGPFPSPKKGPTDNQSQNRLVTQHSFTKSDPLIGHLIILSPKHDLKQSILRLIGLTPKSPMPGHSIKIDTPQVVSTAGITNGSVVPFSNDTFLSTPSQSPSDPLIGHFSYGYFFGT